MRLSCLQGEEDVHSVAFDNLDVVFTIGEYHTVRASSCDNPDASSGCVCCVGDNVVVVSVGSAAEVASVHLRTSHAKVGKGTAQDPPCRQTPSG